MDARADRIQFFLSERFVDTLCPARNSASWPHCIAQVPGKGVTQEKVSGTKKDYWYLTPFPA